MSKFKKFLFFLSSLIPGAGHMFLGFMKRGLLLMTVYFIDIGLSMILNGFLVFMPVIWFYCLFDAWNKFFLSEEERRNVDDSFIFFYNAIPEELLPKSKRFTSKIPQKLYRAIGIALAFFGIVMLCKELRDNLVLPKLAAQILSFVPELLISLALIFIGIRLIVHKKKEIYDSDYSLPTTSNDNSNEEPPAEIKEPIKEEPQDIKEEIEEGEKSEEDPEPQEETQEQKAQEINPAHVELLKSIADDSLNFKMDESDSSELLDDDVNSKMKLQSDDILNDIDASLAPIFEGIEKDAGAKNIEYIWSSPVEHRDNPQ